MAEAKDETVEQDGAPEASSELTDGQIIALRTTDTDEDSIDEYVKVFVYPPGVKPTEANGIDHAANKAAAREFAIQNGLRPTGDAKLKSIKQNRDGVAWDVTITVPVTPTERVEGASEPQIVTGGEDAPANSDGNDHSDDTSDEPASK